MTWLTNPYRFGSGGFIETEHAYWSARILRASGDPGVASVAEIEMAATPGGTDLCTGGSVFYSTQFNGTNEAAANAFNGSLNDRWSNSNGAFPSRIGYQHASPVAPIEFRMWARNDGFTQYGPVGLDWEYSDNGTTHYCYGSADDAAWSNGETRTYDFTGSPYGSYTAMRVYSRTAQDGGGSIRIAELAFAATNGGTNLCTGGTAGGTGASPGNAFDGNPASSTTSAGQLRHFWQYTFASAVFARECRITAATDTANPADVFVQVRLANGLWKTVAQATGLTWTSNETKAFQW